MASVEKVVGVGEKQHAFDSNGPPKGRTARKRQIPRERGVVLAGGRLSEAKAMGSK